MGRRGPKARGTVAAVATVMPAIPLYAYQKAWIEDPARFLIWLKCRQAGGSWASALKVALDALEHRTEWTILSRGERQSKQFMRDVATHLRALELVIEAFEEREQFGEVQYTVLTITLPNGSIIRGLPANADTARGFHGNLVLDEFHYHRDADEIWAATFPIISRGYKCLVLSTISKRGKRGKFYRIWHDKKSRFVRHQINIHEAVTQGCPIDPEDLRSELDPDDFARECLCEWVDDGASFLTYELIEGAEHGGASMELPPDAGKLGPLYLGMDVGRRRHHSVIWIDELVGDVRWTRMVLRLIKAPFAHQREVLWKYVPFCQRACLDSSGLGMQLAEETVARFGASRVEAIDFTAPVKEELAWGLRRALEDKTLRLPMDSDVRESFHSVRKVVSLGVHDRFDADETENHGHADDFWAAALAVQASRQPAWEAPPRGYHRGELRGAALSRGAY